MGNSWVNLADELGAAIQGELTRPGSRRAALIRALREAVRSGRLAPGTRLPPYRTVAAELGLARNTVADAYSELVAEGWLTARQGAGTQVARRAAPVGPPPVDRMGSPVRPERALPVHTLEPGQPDTSAFPRRAWLGSARKALMDAPDDAFGPGDPRGRIELREALSEYLARARGVRTSPERLVVCSGFSHALGLLFGGALSGTLAVESYGFGCQHTILAAASVPTVPLTLDENGARIEELTRHEDVRAVLLTPAHQFPTGGSLASARRPAVLDWARSHAGLVLENDYDGEFRYDRQPVGALQGLDPDRVIYIGSVTSSLSPALGVGWMALPEQLVDPVLAAKGDHEGWAGVLTQLALASFISSGAYHRHIRRMRHRYRRRRDELMQAVAERAGYLRPTGIPAGLHVTLRLPPGTERPLVERATAAGIALRGLAAFRHPDATAYTEGLVIGYGAPSDHGYGPALEALCGVLDEHT